MTLVVTTGSPSHCSPVLYLLLPARSINVLRFIGRGGGRGTEDCRISKTVLSSGSNWLTLLKLLTPAPTGNSVTAPAIRIISPCSIFANPFASERGSLPLLGRRTRIPPQG